MRTLRAAYMDARGASKVAYVPRQLFSRIRQNEGRVYIRVQLLHMNFARTPTGQIHDGKIAARESRGILVLACRLVQETCSDL